MNTVIPISVSHGYLCSVGNVVPIRHASSSLEYHRCACGTATTGISILGKFRRASMCTCKWWRGPLHCSVKTCREYFGSSLSATRCGVLL